MTDDDSPTDSTPDSPSERRKVALAFGALLLVVGGVLLALGLPWQIVAGALALFVVYLLIDS